MIFKNISGKKLKVEGAIGESISKGPGIKHITRKVTTRASEYPFNVTGFKTQHLAIEIEADATFDLPEEYAAPRQRNGVRRPGVFEELVGCAGCQDKKYIRERTVPGPLGDQVVRDHLEHPVCVPSDPDELVQWLLVPEVMKDPNRVSKAELEERQVMQQEELKAENAELKQQMAELMEWKRSLESQKGKRA